MNERDGWKSPEGRAPAPAQDSSSNDPTNLRRRVMLHRRAVERRQAGIEVQLKAKKAGQPESPEAEAIHEAANEGLRGEGSQLPHHQAIQKAFGRHDVSRVRAHLGSDATEAAESMGAEAFASGNRVAFAGTPSLHTAAHEAAHVVQQRAGLRREGGATADDDEHERHADEVADRVVAGESAESLLDLYRADSQGEEGDAQGAPVQHKIKVGKQSYAPGPAVRHLRRDIMIRLAALGFPEKGTKKMWTLVDTWLEAPGIAPKAFGSFDELIGALYNQGAMEKKIPAGASVGPKSLGDRPAWNNDNKTAERGDGEALRHVISSSTMGAAIERCQAEPAVLRAWLLRHGLPLPKEKGPIWSAMAKRAIWAHVHNHAGNLWMGPSAPNSAVGFIRGHLLRAIHNMRNYMVKNDCETVPHDAMLEWLPESFWQQNKQFKSTWNTVIDSLKAIMQPDDQDEVNGTYFIEAALDCMRSCDLDLPPETGPEYFHKVNAVYAEIIGACGPELFGAEGALEQFLALSLQAPGGGGKGGGSKGADSKDDDSSAPMDQKDDAKSDKAMDTSADGTKTSKPKSGSSDKKDESKREARPKKSSNGASSGGTILVLEHQLADMFDPETVAWLRTGDGEGEVLHGEDGDYLLVSSWMIGGELRCSLRKL
jgi:hypothetical protein